MNSLLGLFWCFVLSSAACIVSAADANSPLTVWMDAQTNIHTWSADCTQTRSFKTLTQPLTEKGKVWFKQPNQFRWELGNPPKTIAVRQKNEMMLLYPRLKRVERYPLDSSAPGPWRDVLALLEAGFPKSQAELQSKFRVVSQNVTNNVCDLVLQPRSAAARKMMPQLEISFDLKQTSLRSVSFQFADGSFLRNDFSNPVLNPKIDESIFSPPIPSDYKVVNPLNK
jgi:outer membrane lipoprotein-sorting protein